MKLQARMDANQERTINEIKLLLGDNLEGTKKRNLTSNERTKAAKTPKRPTSAKPAKKPKTTKKVKTTKAAQVNGKYRSPSSVVFHM